MLLASPLLVGTAFLAIAVAYYDPRMFVVCGLAGAAVGWAALAHRPSRGLSAMLRDRSLSEMTRRIFLLLLFVAALAIRLWFSRRVMSNPDFIDTGSDGPLYDRVGWSIAQGHGVPPDFSARYPLILLGYVRVVATIYALAGRSYFAVCVFQSLIGAAACLLFYYIARRAFGAAVAVVASVLAAVSFQLVFSAAAIGHQGVDVFMTAAVVWLLIVYSRDRRHAIPGAALVGVFLGLATAIRETNAIFWIFTELWLLFELRKHMDWRGALRRCAAVAVGFVVIVGPLVAARLATVENRENVRKHLNLLWCLSCGNVRASMGSPFDNPSVANSSTTSQSTGPMTSLAKAVGHNVAVQFFTEGYGAFDLIFLRRDSSFHTTLSFYTYVFASIGLVLAAARIARGTSERALLLLVLGVIASRTVPHLLLESAYRHRAPIEPYLLMLIASGVVVVAGSWMPGLRRIE
jgi:hypothetical protein